MVDKVPFSTDIELLELLEELTDLVQSGNQSAIEQLLQANPHHAEQLRSILPSLNVLADLKTNSTTNGPFPPESFAQTLAASRVLGELGDFRIIMEIGRGGMGVVYEAEQISLGRRVALKVLPFAAVLDQRQIQRFKNEAHAAAQLHHNNIVPVFGIGCERGIYYYAMQYIEGQTLAEVIRELQQVECPEELPTEIARDHSASLASNLFSDNHWAATQGNSRREEHPVPDTCPHAAQSDTHKTQAAVATEQSIRSSHFFRNAANLGAQVAKALDYAHRQGVVHRDIKPSNLILDVRGTVWITDFGLALIENNPGLTMSGDMLGTLRYMSPEQMLAKPGIDHRTDIYSLGVTLYELLTLHPAVIGKHRHEFIKQVAVGQPQAPRKFNRFIPRELETILFKAMEKDPGQRYATASDLAEDLRRFVENRPIKARRPNLFDRAVKWSRRHSDLAWLAAIFLSIGVLAMMATVIWIGQLNEENKYQRQLANDSLIRARQQESLANSARTEAERTKEKLRTELYAKNMNLAFTAWRNHWTEEVDRLLLEQMPGEGDTDLRGFEWYLLRQLATRNPPIELSGHDGTVEDIAVFGDGTRIASVGDDGTIRIWDVSRQREDFELPTDSAALRGGQVYHAVAISPDGKQLVTGQTELSLWDLEQRKFVRDLMKFPTHVSSIAFSADGTLVAAHSADQVLKVISLVNGDVHAFQTDHGSHRLTFSPDGNWLLAPYKKDSRQRQGVSCWDTASWKLIRNYESQSPRALTVSSDGRFLFHGTYGSFVRLIDLSSGDNIFDTPEQRSRVADVALSPDDRILAAVYNDGSLVYWRLREGWQSDPRNAIAGELTMLPAHDRPANAVRFIDRNRLVTCGDDGFVRIWEIVNPRDSRFTWDGFGGNFKISSDGDEIWLATTRGIQICDARTLEPKHEIVLWTSNLDHQKNRTMSLALSDDQRYAAIGDALGNVVLWDRIDNREANRFDQTDIRSSEIDDLAISHDSRWLASAGDDHTIRIRSMEDWEEVLRVDAKGLESTVEFSPDGRILAIGDSDNAIVLLEAGSWKELARAIAKTPVNEDCLRFTRDGKLLVTGHYDSILRVWDTTNMKMIRELKGHTDEITRVAISPDGKTVASTSADGTVRLWHLETFTDIGILHSEIGWTTGCDFSPDGSQLVSARLVTGSEFELIHWQLSKRMDTAAGEPK